MFVSRESLDPQKLTLSDSRWFPCFNCVTFRPLLHCLVWGSGAEGKHAQQSKTWVKARKAQQRSVHHLQMSVLRLVWKFLTINSLFFFFYQRVFCFDSLSPLRNLADLQFIFGRRSTTPASLVLWHEAVYRQTESKKTCALLLLTFRVAQFGPQRFKMIEAFQKIVEAYVG